MREWCFGGTFESRAARTPFRERSQAAKHAGQVSWLRGLLEASFTVARPRGIHTRFPILPRLGHPDALIKKSFEDAAEIITRAPGCQSTEDTPVVLRLLRSSIKIQFP